MNVKTEKNGAPAAEKRRFPLFKILIVLLLLAVLILLLLQQCARQSQGELERELTAEVGLLPDMTDEEIQDKLNQQVAESMLNISMNPTPVFPDGKSEGNVRIENIPGNHYSFTVEIIRSDNDETVMKTGLIDPGHYVENRRLDAPLPAGTYPCVANFTAYNPATQQEIGAAGLQVVLTVEE